MHGCPRAWLSSMHGRPRAWPPSMRGRLQCMAAVRSAVALVLWLPSAQGRYPRAAALNAWLPWLSSMCGCLQCMVVFDARLHAMHGCMQCMDAFNKCMAAFNPEPPSIQSHLQSRATFHPWCTWPPSMHDCCSQCGCFVTSMLPKRGRRQCVPGLDASLPLMHDRALNAWLHSQHRCLDSQSGCLVT